MRQFKRRAWEYAATPIPGVLTVYSNVPNIPNYPLVSTLSPTEIFKPQQLKEQLTIRYTVSPKAATDGKLKGKTFSRPSNNTTHLETPISGIGRLSAKFHHEPDCPEIIVNATYHRLGRLTIGNAHSVGWLLRDLTNIHLLNNSICLLHAAALKSQNKTVILIGLSNTGKTTTVIDLVTHHGVKFFGDDLIAVDETSVYACPLTQTNITPSDLPEFSQKMSHWARRYIPFYENYGPSRPISIADFLGPTTVAEKSNATDILFLKASPARKTSALRDADAINLLIASNRVEFTFAASPLFCAADYLHNSSLTHNAIAQEQWILAQLVKNTQCKLVNGCMADFRRETEISLGLSSD